MMTDPGFQLCNYLIALTFHEFGAGGKELREGKDRCVGRVSVIWFKECPLLPRMLFSS